MAELSREDVQRRMAQWRMAAERERAHARTERRLTSEESFLVAVELIELSDATSRPDPLRERDVEAVRRQWSTLRSVLG